MPYRVQFVPVRQYLTCQWFDSTREILAHWNNLTVAQNLTKIEASDWSRAQNPVLLLVERTQGKCSKGVPLRFWSCANPLTCRTFFTSAFPREKHYRVQFVLVRQYLTCQWFYPTREILTHWYNLYPTGYNLYLWVSIWRVSDLIRHEKYWRTGTNCTL